MKLEGMEQEPVTPPPNKQSKLLINPLVETQVRRSGRLKIKNNFKGDSCADRRCFTSSTTPPIVSTKVIRRLHEQFCKVKVDKVLEENLTKKRKLESAVGAEKEAGKSKDAKD